MLSSGNRVPTKVGFVASLCDGVFATPMKQDLQELLRAHPGEFLGEGAPRIPPELLQAGPRFNQGSVVVVFVLAEQVDRHVGCMAHEVRLPERLPVFVLSVIEFPARLAVAPAAACWDTCQSSPHKKKY